MRHQDPQRVAVAVRMAPAQTAGFQTLHRSQGAALGQFGQRQYAIVVAPFAHDKQAGAQFFCTGAGCCNIGGQRFFTENGFRAPLQLLQNVCMGSAGCHNNHAIHRWQGFERAIRGLGPLLNGSTAGCVAARDYMNSNTQLQEVTQDQPAPTAAAYKPELHRFKRALCRASASPVEKAARKLS